MPTNETEHSVAVMDLDALYARYGYVYAPIGGGDGADDGDGDSDAGSDADASDEENDSKSGDEGNLDALKLLVDKLRKENRGLTKQVKRSGRPSETLGADKPADDKTDTEPALSKIMQRMDAYEQTIAAFQRKEQAGKVSSLAAKAAKAAGAASPSAIARMIHLDDLDLDDDADEQDITDAITDVVATLKAEEPVLFGKRRVSGGGDGGAGAADRRKNDAPADAFGLERLRHAYGSKT